MGPRNGRTTLRARSIRRISVLRVLDLAAGECCRRLTAPKATRRVTTLAVQGSLDLSAPLALLGMLWLFSPSSSPLLLLPVAARLEHTNLAHCAHAVPSHSPALWRGARADGTGVVADGTSVSAVGRIGPALGDAVSFAGDGSAKDVSPNDAGW